MVLTQRLIVVLGDSSLITNESIIKKIGAFKACTVIKTLSPEMLSNVYHYNKNAVLFAENYSMEWAVYNPIVIQLVQDKKSDIEYSLLGVDSIIEDFPKILARKSVDSGDHATQNSDGMVNQSTEDCLMCQIYKHTSPNKEHIVYETKNFFVVPGTGAFFDGYLMIVPKKHVMSFSLLGEKVLREFYHVLNDIRSILEGIYGKKVFAFECASGRTGAGKHKTSIVHAHFHLAPTEMPVIDEVQKSGIYPHLIHKENFTDYGEYPYMLYIDQQDNWFMACDPNTYYPRQHPRQVLAEWMGDYEHYNWRIYPMREKMPIIAEEFRSYCRQHFAELPEWVQNSVVFDD